MKFLFDDETFAFETLRTAGFALYGGADLGEVLGTASAITDGDEASWHRAWKATAQRLHDTGEKARVPGTGSAPGRPCCAHRTTTGPRRTSCLSIRPPTRK